ncbi:hypothetical protein G6011_02081 [Alternaria panax]|uniref:C3H1-type domain-containing protein n=1 Tax=Alternaria panax TaxID=48097 RepID=A0AAD4I6Z4_9PLEO|nr:hypothetical protein G6011_02081 [Alternaria panax]
MAFRFPPPPPPPPKATSSEQPYASQRGGHARGGSDRGRGRGGNQSRGGGFNNPGGNARGGHGQNCGRGDARGRGGQRGYQNNRGGANHRGGYSAGNGQHEANAPSNTASANGYNNPSFAGGVQTEGAAPQQYDPSALAQVMSYMSTPSGVQSMAAYANHMTSTGSSSNPQSQQPHQNQLSPRYSPQQHAGQKRKLNDRNHNPQSQTNVPQLSSKPPRAKAAVPPQIPSFGFSLPPPPVVRSDNKKRKVNLGLSQQPVPDESSDEEDIDEEVAYTEKLKGGGFAFEHNGETISIQTGAEVAAWIKDRRRNFPTEKRANEKAEETARKRAAELDFLRRVSGKPPREDNIDTPNPRTKPREKRQDDKAKKEDGVKHDADNRRQEELAALRKKLHESMVKKQSAPNIVDLGLGYESETESEAESSVLSDSSVVSSSEEDESESEADDSDEAPETTSSKLAPPPIRVPPPPRAPRKAETKSVGVCTNWKRNGRCPYFSKCRYQHPPKEDEKLPGLYERMVEQELVRADQLALDAIKYLGQNGFLG